QLRLYRTELRGSAMLVCCGQVRFVGGMQSLFEGGSRAIRVVPFEEQGAARVREPDLAARVVRITLGSIQAAACRGEVTLQDQCLTQRFEGVEQNHFVLGRQSLRIER